MLENADASRFSTKKRHNFLLFYYHFWTDVRDYCLHFFVLLRTLKHRVLCPYLHDMATIGYCCLTQLVMHKIF
jgi:hypothetical protein